MFRDTICYTPTVGIINMANKLGYPKKCFIYTLNSYYISLSSQIQLFSVYSLTCFLSNFEKSNKKILKEIEA